MSQIKTEKIYPPIPIRKYDWQAYREDYDKGDLIGTGATEREAIEDLIDQEQK